MPLSSSIPVSPRHRVTLDDDYLALVERAPREDFVVRVLTSRTAGDRPLMTGEIVIAGVAAREAFPLAARYPLHFRKTYYPGRLHGDTAVEFARQREASALIDIPPAIGHTRSTFRSCLLPGTPLDRLSGLGTEPEESNIAAARAMPLSAAAGLWHVLELGFDALTRLHRGGLSHGDVQPHNLIVCASPLEVVPVDFESAVVQDAVDAEAWARLCEADVLPLLRLAVYVQCALGRQRGALSEQASQRLAQIVRAPGRFQRAIAERTYDAGLT